MEKNIKQKLLSVYNALNNVEVKGRNNCATIAGSITVIEEILSELNKEDGDEIVE